MEIYYKSYTHGTLRLLEDIRDDYSRKKIKHEKKSCQIIIVVFNSKNNTLFLVENSIESRESKKK